jgi:hypothetical protein
MAATATATAATAAAAAAVDCHMRATSQARSRTTIVQQQSAVRLVSHTPDVPLLTAVLSC